MTYLGTPQSEMSIYNKLPERGYETCIWTARIPEKPEKYQGRLAPYIQKMIEQGCSVGTVTDPLRFTHEDLLAREASYGRSGFALQFMLDTSLSDENRYPLKLSDLIVMSLDPMMAPTKIVWSNGAEYRLEGVPCVGMNTDRYYRPMWVSPDLADYTGSVLAIDPSGRGKDETSYAVVKMLFGRLFLTDMGGLKGGYSEATLQKLAQIAQMQKVNQIVIESNMGDGMFTELFKPILAKVHPCAIEEVRATTQKERRIIDVLEPVLNQHRLVVDQRLIRKDFDSSKAEDGKETPIYGLFYQLTRITKDKGSLSKDDRLDALAWAVKYWIDQLAQDPQSAATTHQSTLLDQEIQRMEHFTLGTHPKTASWLN